MSQLNLPLERLQHFGAPAPLIAQPFDHATDWTAGSGLLPLRRPADDIRFSPFGTQMPIGGQIANSLFATMPQMGPIGQLIQQLFGMLQQFLGALGIGSGTSPENAYADATASSTGDPHLAFNGTRTDGQVQNTRFDSMVNHNDLLDSDSFAGGYQVSTQVTAPGSNGVTSNQRATIATNYGNTQVSLDRSGNASITEGGQAVSIATGQTLDLGNGETVTKNNDGSLSVINVSGEGGTLNTTLRATGGGVDVTTSAHDVDLGGDLVNGPPQPQPPELLWNPVMHPMRREPMYLA